MWFRTRFWFERNSLLPASLFVASGLAYTVWSEWHNTRIVQTWAYTPSMPTVYGVGLSPIAQWLVIPSLLVLLLRRRRISGRLEPLSNTAQ
ncbi:MAG: hypothetical protein L0Z50_29805 [Verrucomicrobiales bacterium]|nr:hypothetical protein [Verrucomicrobiales bacterium]